MRVLIMRYVAVLCLFCCCCCFVLFVVAFMGWVGLWTDLRKGLYIYITVLKCAFAFDEV